MNKIVAEWKGKEEPCTIHTIHLSDGHLVLLNLSISKEDDEWKSIAISSMLDQVTPSSVINLIAECGLFPLLKDSDVEKIHQFLNVSLEEVDYLKDILQNIIDKYDQSEEVNCFILNKVPMWIPRETRVSLMNSTTIQQNLGIAKTTLWYGSTPIEIACEDLLSMLMAVEMYAMQCYNVTASHKAEVSKFTTIAQIMNYDITKGYPNKLDL